MMRMSVRPPLPGAQSERKSGDRPWLAFLSLFIVLSLVALLFAAQNWITGGPYGRLLWPRNITVALVQWWTWLPFAPLLFRLAERQPLKAGSRQAAIWWIFAAGLSLFLHVGLVAIIEQALDRVTPGEALGLTVENLLRKRAGIDVVTLIALILCAHMLRRARLPGAHPETVRPALQTDRPLTVQKGNRTLFLRPSEIEWVEAAGNYAVLYNGDGEHVLRTTLADLETRLAARFARISRSALVNLSAVAGMKDATRNGDTTLVLRSGKELRLTRTFRRAIADRLSAI